jgi:hypothetical protein
MAWRGSWFRDRRKRDEPQDRQRDATSPQDRRGVSRRGGAKPRGRNAGGCGYPPRRARKRPGVDSAIGVDGGAIFGQPQERKPGDASHRVARTGRCRKTARRSGGSRAPSSKVMECGPIEGPSRAGARKRSKAEEGGGERQRNHDFDRVFPPRDASRRACRRARTLWRRTLGNERGAEHDVVASSFGSRSSCPAVRGKDVRRKADETLKTP